MARPPRNFDNSFSHLGEASKYRYVHTIGVCPWIDRFGHHCTRQPGHEGLHTFSLQSRLQAHAGVKGDPERWTICMSCSRYLLKAWQFSKRGP